MQKIHRLDFMIAYACNLACRGCISLSDFDRKGIASLAEITEWTQSWSKVIQPEIITLFGGEPTLHPDLIKVCEVIKQYWPDTTIRLITNGYLLDNFNSDAWFNFAPFEMQVSIHRKDHESIINNSLKKILSHYSDWTVKKIGGDDHKQLEWSRSGFKLYKSMFGEFVAPYMLVDSKPQPANSNPADAHKICGSPDTPVLYKNKLYKCPAVANAIDYTNENWFNYRAMTSEDDLTKFINDIGVPEAVCGQCPNQQQAIIFDHLLKENVVVKKKSLN